MRTLISVAVLAASAVACSGTSSPATTGDSASNALTAADSAAIVAVNARLSAAGLSSDWDAWSADFITDPVRLPPNAPTVSGKASSDAFNRATPKFTTFDVAITSIVGRADLAVATGSFKLSMAAGQDSSGKPTPAVNDQGKFVQVLMKQPDGSWKIARDIWNSDLPVVAAPATK
jgi:ketosteroid isomerase-like protein